MAAAVTIGVDIGTTSVKAVAADGDGRVVATARVTHPVLTPAPNVLEHDARLAWRDGVRAAARQVAEAAVAAGHTVAGVNVAAMVPSLCPVDRRRGADRAGTAVRRRAGQGWRAGPGPVPGRRAGPHAHLDGGGPSGGGRVLAGAGRGQRRAVRCRRDRLRHGHDHAAVVRLHGVGPGGVRRGRGAGRPAPRHPLRGRTGGHDRPGPGTGLAGAVVGGGTIDAFGEQLVAGADQVGDVLLIMGATLIVWACVADWVEAPGLWTVPHTAPGKVLVGGPSNAGGSSRTGPPRSWYGPARAGDAGGDVTAGERSTRPTCRWCCRTCGASGPRCTTGTGGRRSTGCPSPTDRRPCGAPSTRPRATRSATTSTWPGSGRGPGGPPHRGHRGWHARRRLGAGRGRRDRAAGRRGGRAGGRRAGLGLPGPGGRGAGAGRLGRVPLGPHLAPGGAGPAVGGPVCGAPPHVRGATGPPFDPGAGA